MNPRLRIIAVLSDGQWRKMADLLAAAGIRRDQLRAVMADDPGLLISNSDRKAGGYKLSSHATKEERDHYIAEQEHRIKLLREKVNAFRAEWEKDPFEHPEFQFS